MKVKQKYRTLFISDVHMGSKISRTEELIDFLKSVKVEKIYLVGDIIDIMTMKRKFFWDSSYNAVIRRLIKMTKSNVEIIYIPGNHDSEIRDFNNMDFAGIRIRNEDVHTTLNGMRFLVIHGDEFDGALRAKMFFLYSIGDRFYDMAVSISSLLGAFLKLFGKNWSLSQYLKSKVKNVVQFINSFEKILVQKARSRNVNGIICGHIHTGDLKKIEDVIYANCGCWTESCNAIVEDMDGKLELLDISEGKVKVHKLHRSSK